MQLQVSSNIGVCRALPRRPFSECTLTVPAGYQLFSTPDMHRQWIPMLRSTEHTFLSALCMTISFEVVMREASQPDWSHEQWVRKWATNGVRFKAMVNVFGMLLEAVNDSRMQTQEATIATVLQLLNNEIINGDIGAMLTDSPSAFLVSAQAPEMISFFARNSNSSSFERLVQRFDAPAEKSSDAHFTQRESAIKVAGAFIRHLNKKRGDMPSHLGAVSGQPAFLKAFCRVGSVQAFIFGMGGVQFNFPDKTKLIFSPDGNFVSFYHLPSDVGRKVQQKEFVQAELDHTMVLHMPLSIMLSCSPAVNQWLFELLDANEFRQKVKFIKDVLRVWEQNGGPGKGRDKLDWTGMAWQREEPKEPSWGRFDI